MRRAAGVCVCARGCIGLLYIVHWICNICTTSACQLPIFFSLVLLLRQYWNCFSIQSIFVCRSPIEKFAHTRNFLSHFIHTLAAHWNRMNLFLICAHFRDRSTETLSQHSKRKKKHTFTWIRWFSTEFASFFSSSLFQHHFYTQFNCFGRYN